MRAQRFVSPPRYGCARSHESAASPVIRADLTGWPRHRAVIVGSARPPGGVRSIQTLGARKAHMRDRLASCSCGQLRAEVIGDPVRVSICHCLACQRRTGSVFGQQARFRRENVSLSGASSEYGAWATKALASGSTSAQAADRRCTTSLKEWKNTWRYLLERLLIQAFQRRSFQFTNRGCTAGSFPLPTPSISREQSGT